MTLEIHEIDWPARRIVTSDARTLPIIDLFDGCGRPLDSPSGAVLAVAGEAGAYVTFKLRPFDRRKLQ